MSDFQKFITNKYLYVPLMLWFSIQTFKVIYELIKTKKFNFKRIIGAGGMPSSHSAITMCISTMIGKSSGFDSSIYALSLIGIYKNDLWVSVNRDMDEANDKFAEQQERENRQMLNSTLKDYTRKTGRYF